MFSRSRRGGRAGWRLSDADEIAFRSLDAAVVSLSDGGPHPDSSLFGDVDFPNGLDPNPFPTPFERALEFGDPVVVSPQPRPAEDSWPGARRAAQESREAGPTAARVDWNLHNNLWNTNYPAWYPFGGVEAAEFERRNRNMRFRFEMRFWFGAGRRGGEEEEEVVYL